MIPHDSLNTHPAPMAAVRPRAVWVVAAQHSSVARLSHRLVRMTWIILLLAGLAEIGWAIGLKYTDGFSRPVPTGLTVVSMLVSIGLLGLAMKHLPVGTAYAVWTGIGTVGTVILGMILMGDSTSPMRLACLGLIMLGIIGLKLSA